jgi:hypothetical protein
MRSALSSGPRHRVSVVAEGSDARPPVPLTASQKGFSATTKDVTEAESALTDLSDCTEAQSIVDELLDFYDPYKRWIAP